MTSMRQSHKIKHIFLNDRVRPFTESTLKNKNILSVFSSLYSDSWNDVNWSVERTGRMWDYNGRKLTTKQLLGKMNDELETAHRISHNDKWKHKRTISILYKV